MACVYAPQDTVIAELRVEAGANLRNWLAGFDLAAYLYVKGEEIRADDVFSSLKLLELGDWEKRRPRQFPPFVENTPLKGSGRISVIHETCCFIKRADHPLDIYLIRHFVENVVDSELNYGTLVDFDIRFSLEGPLATSVRLSGSRN